MLFNSINSAIAQTFISYYKRNYGFFSDAINLLSFKVKRHCINQCVVVMDDGFLAYQCVDNNNIVFNYRQSQQLIY